MLLLLSQPFERLAMPKRTFLSSLLAYCFLLAIGSGNISALLAQGYTLSVQELSSGGIAPSQLAKINQQVQYSITLSFSAQQVEEILAQRPTQITVELPSVLPLQRTIVLSAFEIFTPDAKSYVGTVTGDKEISFRNEWASYRGHLQGDDRSVVVMNFSKQGVDAMFSLSNAQYFIRPIAGEQSTMERPSMFFSSAAEKGTTPFRCGLRDEKAAAAMEAIIQDIQSRNFGAESQKGKTAGQRLNFNPAPTSNLFGPAISTDTIEVRVALEGDYTFFQLMGTAQAATNLMTSAVTYASAIYLRDVNVKLVIPFTRVWDTPNDPYSNTDIFTTLNEFVNYWRLNMGTVDRTTAHLFTSPTGWMSSFGVAGIARLNTLCNPEEAYAVTSVKLPNGTEHLMTFAHELGHNFGAYHTHSCLWPNGPIDFCSAVEGGCYSGPTVNQEGTIMSYCGTRRAEFGAIVSSLMRRTVETSWCAPSVPSMAVAQSDSVFIESLFSATGGTAWLNKTNWQSGRVPGRYGVAVRSGRVVSIDLPANNLIGTLPQGLENLTALRKLNLSGKNYHHDMQVQPHSQSLERFNANRISGQIPTNIGQLTALEFLDLSNNLLNGTIPSQLSALQQLRWLNLSENFDLGGTIPSSLGSLLNLELLDLYRVGRLTGSIPPQLGSATQLRVLILSEDRSLTGSIPTELASIPKLRLLKLDNCALTGTIPTGLANVTTLEQIVLSNNKLTGSIPADIGNLLALNTLSLDLNQLTGTIPASIVNLTKLSWLDLSDNQLTGSIPAGIGNIDLMHLGLGNNKLTGQIPVTLGKLSSLLDFIISGNQLTGTIPDTLRNLGKNAVSDFGGLLMFRVGDNQLTGPVPSWLSQLSTVSQLDIGGNLLDAQNAPIPDWILNRSGWVILHLHNLQYTGAFPTQLMTKTSLQSLKLSGNKFTGSIPTTIGNLSGLSTLWLSNNQLTGSIPFQLGNAQGMRDLRLNNNQFSGALPAEIGNMRNLQYGYFDFNQFSGAVPIEFEQLGSMVQLALNDNDLTSVPDLTRLALLHSDPTSFLSVENNRLTFTTLSTIVGFNTQAPLVKFTYAPQKIHVRSTKVIRNRTNDFSCAQNGRNLGG
ncbi:MAG: hypothetical protein HY088_01040 [Ignavibacteriales bacterium]|nr:hypothetical protein [Ignavibacteriales bacterium]